MRVILVNPFDQTIKEAVYGGFTEQGMQEDGVASLEEI